MKKFAYFMAVGLAFTVLQVATVEADMIPGTDCAATPGGPEAVAACWDAQAAAGGGDHPCSGMTGDALIKCTEENPPPSGTSAAGGPPTLTLEDPQCQLAPADRDPGCPTMATTNDFAGADHAENRDDMGNVIGADCADPANKLLSECGGGGDTGVALTIGDPKCIVGAGHRDPGCPNFGQP